ncbi:MAG: leucine-rich repeat domain-containing protein [Mogibacterium sp.]|uniref:leucine-rich repeat domain-containing protein n=1 Tax=Mogibacterium sp. TaxID=2049035 RepID=UPI001A5F6194|nr:leucine-rich repeat domain-containing protein [Mogibacterium sp.]MBL6468074.1 leucine-rich repeat domain-containing protein [Mogibacterium sp.]
MKRKKQIAWILTAILMVVCACTGSIYAAGANCGGLEEKDVFYPEKDDVIQDPALHWAVRAAMNITGEKRKLTKEDVASSYVKYISYEQSSHPENFTDWKMPWYVESLEGLQYATSARQIDIGYTANKPGQKIRDLSPISGLTQLDQLFLKGDGIDDISALKNLTNLTSLWLNENQIQDISAVQGMKKLSQLSLCGNKLTDVQAAMDLPRLRSLDLSRNAIETLPEDMSGLKNLISLDLSDNPGITDVSSVASVKTLQRLSLVGDNAIKDIRPLANLTSLDEEQTYLPAGCSKTDLFAAIAVNRNMEEFSVSNMTAADFNAVEKALESYEKLTDEQKTYIDSGKVQAIRDNKAKVEKGEEPDSYPEYENNAPKTPIFDRIEIKVVNRKGVPLEGIPFVKEKKTEYVDETENLTTDENGMLILKHKNWDAVYDKIIIHPADGTKTDPGEITYTVTYGGEGGPTRVTGTVNGKKATGLETLKFVLQEDGEEEALENLSALVEKVQKAAGEKEGFRYTSESWENYEAILEKARSMVKNQSGTVAQMNDIGKKLQEAFDGLQKVKHLTTIKLTIRNKDGKHIGRAYKFQVRNTKNHANAWNEYSDEKTGIAYIPVSPGWTEGTVWEIRACVQEPMDMEPITVTTAKDGNRWYFKTIDGKPADVDFERTVSVWTKDEKSDAGKVASVSLSEASYTYNGKVRTPFVKAKDSAGNMIPKSEYTVKYDSGRKNVGQYKATITFKGKYSGTYCKTFRILPKGTKLKKVSAGKKSFTAKWSRQKTQTTGYQVQYSQKKNFKSGAKTVTIGKTKTTAKKVTGLKKKKTYYVRIRTYKTVKISGKKANVVSAWSSAKKVKTK